jgi:GNAT superfamily N-acetyltransferase
MPMNKYFNLLNLIMSLNPKPVVRKAKTKELAWLFANQEHFAEPYNVPTGELRKEWPCFVMIKGGEVIGFRYFQIHDVEGKKHAWVGRTCLKKGFTGKGLGPTLVGTANRYLHAKGYELVQTHAYKPKAKRFWLSQGYTRVKGALSSERGNTQFKLDLKKQRRGKSLR